MAVHWPRVEFVFGHAGVDITDVDVNAAGWSDLAVISTLD